MSTGGLPLRRTKSQSTHRKIPTKESELGQRGGRDARAQKATSSSTSAQSKFSPTSSSLDSRSSSDQVVLSHLTPSGEAHMVDISGKADTTRTATATTVVHFSQPGTYEALLSATATKGDALAVARIAGIQGAKKTADIIPLAHPGLGLTSVTVSLTPFTPKLTTTLPKNDDSQGQSGTILPVANCGGVSIRAIVSCHGKTGVEMEALTSATVAALTLYDMLKGIDKNMEIAHCRVISKSGGKSGDWYRSPVTRKIVYTEFPQQEGQAAHPEHPQSKGTLQFDTEPKTISVTNQDIGLKQQKVREKKKEIALDQVRFEHERLRLQLASIDMDKEVNNRAIELLKSKLKLTPENEMLLDDNQDERTSVLNTIMDSISKDYRKLESKAMKKPEEGEASSNEPSSPDQSISTQTEPQLSGLASISESASSSESRSSLEPESTRLSTSPSSTLSSEPSNVINHSHTGSDLHHSPTLEPNPDKDEDSTTEKTYIHFNRASRDLMSGTFPSRADRQGFEAKRTERYEDWIKTR